MVTLNQLVFMVSKVITGPCPPTPPPAGPLPISPSLEPNDSRWTGVQKPSWLLCLFPGLPKQCPSLPNPHTRAGLLTSS